MTGCLFSLSSALYTCAVQCRKSLKPFNGQSFDSFTLDSQWHIKTQIKQFQWHLSIFSTESTDKMNSSVHFHLHRVRAHYRGGGPRAIFPSFTKPLPSKHFMNMGKTRKNTTTVIYNLAYNDPKLQNSNFVLTVSTWGLRSHSIVGNWFYMYEMRRVYRILQRSCSSFKC